MIGKALVSQPGYWSCSINVNGGLLVLGALIAAVVSPRGSCTVQAVTRGGAVTGAGLSGSINWTEVKSTVLVQVRDYKMAK